MSEWRPYRLALLATSPALAGEAKRAGWAYTKSLVRTREANMPQTKSLPRAARGRGTAKRWKGRLGRFLVFCRERVVRDTGAPIASLRSALPPYRRGKLKEQDGRTLKASNSAERRTRHRRPYRLTAFGTSPVLTGEAKRAGWAYTKSPARRGKLICRRRKASPVRHGGGGPRSGGRGALDDFWFSGVREPYEIQASLSPHCVRHFPRIGGGS